MSRNQSEGKNFKPLIIAVSILLVLAAVVAAVFIIPRDGKKTGTGESSVSAAEADSEKSTTGKTDSEDTPQAIPTSAGQDKDGSSLPEGTASELIKGAEAVNRWEASSVISNVTVEKVRVSLDVYENGSKTGNKKEKYMYAAIVETRPSRVTMLNSYEFTSKRVTGLPSIVSGYEDKKEETVLFACSNEYCAADSSNPNGNIYYIAENSLEATVIKNGILAQQGKMSPSVSVYKDGTWKYPEKISLSSSEDLIKNGIVNSVSFTYPVIWEGKKCRKVNEDIKYDIFKDFKIAPSGTVDYDRTLIGKIDENKYAFLISEEFSGGYLIDYMMNDLGAEYAYWGAGGYSTGMYIKGYGVITKNNYVSHGDLFCVK